MLTRLIALLVLLSALAVLGQDRLKLTSYTRGLEQESVRGHTIGVTDGDTIKVLTDAKTNQGPYCICRCTGERPSVRSASQTGHERVGIRQRRRTPAAFD